ncbi:hypothetical protein [Microbulbifer taiwanensis]|uniref:Uncharacterized protein n=1 Tax=Microbulbifer taiwanensis TaxID=986746 RepID=A0ABW1YLW3_9GAMM|nr:hypothetical protein [Microbulbifer taiwanensis]
MFNKYYNLVKVADRLHSELASYSGNDKSIYELKSSLEDLLSQIRSGKPTSKMNEDEVPGVYQWKNSGMGWPDEIRNSYFELKQALSGGRSEGVKEFLKRVGKDGKL